MVEEPDLRIAVVKDHILGTNDCRGWVRESFYRKLKIAQIAFASQAGIRRARTEAGKGRIEGNERSRGRQARGRHHPARERLQNRP